MPSPNKMWNPSRTIGASIGGAIAAGGAGAVAGLISAGDIGALIGGLSGAIGGFVGGILGDGIGYLFDDMMWMRSAFQFGALFVLVTTGVIAGVLSFLALGNYPREIYFERRLEAASLHLAIGAFSGFLGAAMSRLWESIRAYERQSRG